MRQINNGFMPYYYISENGKIYNREKEKEIKPIEGYSFRLKTIDNQYKRINLKKIYRIIFDKEYCIDDIENYRDEEWKPIERTDDRYFISNKGRVKSLAGYEAIILKPNHVNGYERVDIVVDGIRSSRLVSRLVASAFLKAPAALDMQLHHIDGNKYNNNADNLIWLTPKEHFQIHNSVELKSDKEKNDVEL